jgi:pimeloyl-ACP methyl ester carboxylesterase
MRLRLRVPFIALLAVSTLAVVPAVAQETTDKSIVTTEVTFTVKNTNRSKLPCPTDGQTYRLNGTLVMPAAKPTGVTVWLHNGIGNKNTFLVPIRNYHFGNEMAKLGHATVALNMLGNGDSDKPADGNMVCPGSDADVVYQAMEQLRTGNYEGSPHPSFEKVAVGGFSLGAWIAELIGVSFPHVDGIIPIGGSFGVLHPDAAVMVANSAMRDCHTVPYYIKIFTPQQRTHWAFYAPNSDADVIKWMEENAYTAEPCGVWEHLPASTAAVDALGPATNPDLKVLVVLGDKDLILPPPNGHLQVARFSNSHDVSLMTMPNTGHAVLLERNAPIFRDQLHDWMAQRGL